MIKHPLEFQTFNDGLVEIYEAVAPRMIAANPKFKLRFHRRTVGFSRFYTAQQVNAKIENLLRCPFVRGVSTQDIALLDGKPYRITLIQRPEELEPPCMDLTLEEVDGDYATNN